MALEDHDYHSIDYAPTLAQPRHFAALVASVVAHVALISSLIFFGRLPDPPHEWVLAYIIELGGGAVGEADAGKGRQPPPIDLPPLSTPPRPAYAPEASPKLVADSELPDAIAVPVPRAGVMKTLTVSALRPLAHSAGGANVGSSGNGTGNGASSGSGSGSAEGTGNGNIAVAYADYGVNPPPAYPARSRMRDEQGTVVLRVLVAIDGSAERVAIAESSGFDALDQAAEETVRTRWRFVPAHRAGRPVASWVLVPIKFALK